MRLRAGSIAENAFVPYSPSDFVLLVGEGNFSFARALARRFGGLGTRIVATSYDTREQVLAKYPDATEILEELNTAGVTVVHGVDATQLETNKDLRAAIATMMYVEDSSAGVSHANAGQVASHGDNGSSIDEVDATRAVSDGSNNSGSDSESESESERADGDETARAPARQRIDIFGGLCSIFRTQAAASKDTLENNRVHQRFLTAFFALP